MTAPVASAASGYLVLDAAYRAAVAQTAIGVIRIMQLWWTSVDPADLARTSSRWLETSVLTILAAQARTASIADAYTEQVRRLSIPGALPWKPPPLRPENPERIRKSLIFTGIHQTAEKLAITEKSLQGGQTDEERDSDQRTQQGRNAQLMSEGLARAAGSAIRLVTDAGQERIYDNVVSDPTAIGWARTTKPGCCYFCAMLASRGFVYKEDSFSESDARFIGPGQHKVHDTCGCGLRPLYNQEDPLPDRNEDLSDLWASEAARYSGQEAIKAFRRAYEASPLSQPANVV
jgi:hypothetical protein